MTPPAANPGPPGWIVSARFDLLWIIGPGVFALALVGTVPALRAPGTDVPLWVWASCILLVDVAHVWSTIYRTYLDPEARRLRGDLLLWAPAACMVVGVMLHSVSPLSFWRGLAYLAVIHFVRQQYGLVALYGRRGGWASSLDARIDKAVLYAVTLYPILNWHTRLPRPFVWFVPGDFAALPPWLDPLGRAVWVLALATFVLRMAWLATHRGPVSPGRILVVSVTATTWYVGIVALESDIAFTITNVIAHGAPYLALIWRYVNQRHGDRCAGPTRDLEESHPEASSPAPVHSVRARFGWLRTISRPWALPAFIALPVVLAWGEEFLWDNMYWLERPLLFGDFHAWFEGARNPSVMSLLVPLLALPQATHYVLDAYLWTFDGSNPGLEEALFGSEGGPTNRLDK